MMKRILAVKIKRLHINLHVKLHRYFELGLRIWPVKESIFSDIYSVDFHFCFGFLTVYLNLNVARSRR